MGYVKVSYYDPFGLWPQLREAFEPHLPLQSLQIKLPRRPTHIVSHLALDFISFDIQPNLPPPTDNFWDPTLHVMVLGCDDMETYRHAVRPQIASWRQTSLLHKDTEWLIINVLNSKSAPTPLKARSQDIVPNSNSWLRNGTSVSNPTSQPSPHGHSLSASNLLNQLKGTSYELVNDKIRSDLKVGRRERVYPIKLHDCSEAAAGYWGRLVEGVKALVSVKFERDFARLEAAAQKLDSQRRFVGWNFCGFFIVKESLAHALEALHRYRESLKVYDELEVVLQTSKDLYGSWFAGPGEFTAGSFHLLGYATTALRAKIATNQISVFDFRAYLFARQMHLLSRACDLEAFADRALRFIGTFPNSVRELKGRTLPSERAAYADRSIREGAIPGGHSSSDLKLSKVRHSLLWLAKTQLDRLGILYGQLPPEPPFTHALDKRWDLGERLPTATLEPLGATLKASLSSTDAFDSLYISLCQQIKAECAVSGWPRFTLAIHGSLAALHFARGRYASAIASLEDVHRYLEEGWFEMALAPLGLLVKAYECVRRWHPLAHLCLKALSTLPEHLRPPFSDTLLESLRHAGEGLSCAMPPHLLLESVARVEGAGDFSLEVGIVCRLAKVSHFAGLRVTSSTEGRGWVTYGGENIQLAAGLNAVRVTCEHPAAGKFSVVSVAFKLGPLTLSQEFPELAYVVSFYEHPLTLQLAAELSPNDLGLEIDSRTNQVTEATLKLEVLDCLDLPLSGEVAGFIRSEGRVRAVSVDFWCEGDLLVLGLPSLLPHQAVSIAVPCSPKVGLGARVTVSRAQLKCLKGQFPSELAYRSLQGPKVGYRQLLETGLEEQPFSVSSSWFPKGDGYYLALKLHASQSRPPQRVHAVQMHAAPRDVGALDSSSSPECVLPLGSQHAFTVFPGQSLDYVFDIDPTLEASPGGAPTTVYMMVQYSSILREVELGLAELLKPLLQAHGLAHHRRKLAQLLSQSALQSGQLSHYAMSGKLRVDQLGSSAQTVEEACIAKILNEFCRLHPSLEVQDISGLVPDRLLRQTFSVKMCVALPAESISVRVHLQGEVIPLGEGCEITYSLALHAEAPLEMVVTVLPAEADSSYWAISGKTKHAVRLLPGEGRSFAIVGTPIRVGYVPLPQLRISLKEFKAVPPEPPGYGASPTATDPTAVASHPLSMTNLPPTSYPSTLLARCRCQSCRPGPWVPSPPASRPIPTRLSVLTAHPQTSARPFRPLEPTLCKGDPSARQSHHQLASGLDGGCRPTTLGNKSQASAL
ncbi:hypothetical protein L0F63_002486 [Massospora cicadina]|nr:hypothetical protein L0F63_002486 [Massospora cicadina]